MPSAIQSQSQVQEVLGILRRRSWQIILPTATVLSLGVAAAVIVPKKYEVQTEIELRNSDDSELGKLAKVASHQIRAFERVMRVIEDQQWPDYLALRDDAWRREFVRDVLKNIAVGNTPGSDTSSFVRIEYKDVNPKRAIEFLIALRKSWVSEVLERERNLAIGEETQLLEERNELQRQYNAEELALSELRKRHGISATQPTPGGGQVRDEDPVFQRIRKSEEELLDLEKELAKLDVEIEAKTQLYHEEPATVAELEKLAGLSVDKDLEKIDLEIRRIEKERAKLKPANSQWRIYTRDLQALALTRERIAARATEDETRQRTQPNPKLVLLREELEALKLRRELVASQMDTVTIALQKDQKRHNELQEVYRQVRQAEESISRVQGGLENSAKAYQLAKRKVERLRSEEGNPFAITEEPRLSPKPTEPNPMLIVAFSLFAGLGLGFGLAVLAEFGRSSFRNAADVSRALAAPVLGAINVIITRSEARAAALRRVAVGIVCLSFIAAVIFVTWAWAVQQDLLPQEVRDAIEDLRAQLQ